MINIHDFIADKTDNRRYLKQPFNFAGKTIASNGFILAAFPFDSQYPNLSALKKPDTLVPSLTEILQAISLSNFYPIKIKLPNPNICKSCQGTKTVTIIDCEECEGDGSVTFNNGIHDYECDCKNCDGKGEIVIPNGKQCPFCQGTGFRYSEDQTVLLHGIYLDPNYIQLINNEPDLMVATEYHNNRLFFKTGDIVGAIYGINRKYRHEQTL